jgi:hypothetical protein
MQKVMAKSFISSFIADKLKELRKLKDSGKYKTEEANNIIEKIKYNLNLYPDIILKFESDKLILDDLNLLPPILSKNILGLDLRDTKCYQNLTPKALNKLFRKNNISILFVGEVSKGAALAITRKKTLIEAEMSTKKLSQDDLKDIKESFEKNPNLIYLDIKANIDKTVKEPVLGGTYYKNDHILESQELLKKLINNQKLTTIEKREVSERIPLLTHIIRTRGKTLLDKVNIDRVFCGQIIHQGIEIPKKFRLAFYRSVIDFEDCGYN